MSLKVIQWSTGNVGRHALRQIIRHDDLELVGLWVHSADKAGRDAGELAGLDPVGVAATDDVEALLALGADCVCYTATADLRPDAAVSDMAAILSSGANVVSRVILPVSRPLASGSRVPQWPTARSRSTLRADLTTSCEVGPVGLSMSSAPPRGGRR